MEAHDNRAEFHRHRERTDPHGRETPYRQPAGVDWASVRPDQFADIPFLREVRAAMEARKGAR